MRSDRPDPLERYLPVLAATSALVLMVLSIGHRDLWSDEALTVTSTHQLWESLQLRSASMALYYVFMTPWADISLDPVWLRLPSALLMAVAVGLTCRLAIVHFGNRVAMWTALVMVPMYGVTRWGQEVRSYSLVMALAAGTWLLFFRFVDRRTTRDAVLWGLCGAALVYSHPLAGLVLASQVLATRAYPREANRLTRQLVPGLVTVGLLLVPMLLTFRGTGAHPEWVAPLGWHSVGDAFFIFGGRYGLPQAVMGVALIGATVLALAARTDDPVTRWKRLSMAFWTYLTPAVLLVISIGEPMFVERYLLAALPGASILMGLGLSRLDPRPLRTLVGAVVLLALVPGQISLVTNRGDRWGELADLVASDAADGRRVGVAFARSFHRQAFEVNAAGHEVLEQTVPIYPTTPWGTFLRYHEEPTPREFEEVSRELDVIWLVYQVGAVYDGAEGDEYVQFGFCLDRRHAVPTRLQAARFVPCTESPVAAAPVGGVVVVSEG